MGLPGPDTGAGAGTPAPGAPLSAGGIFASPPATGYNAPSATTGTIVNVPQLDFPGVVSVVPSAVIRDQDILRVDDLIRDVPAAAKTVDNGFRPDAFLIRGFVVGARDYRWNGFQDFSPAPRDFANVERVEILQGPGSVLYGSGQPSGVVNFITKKPVDDNFIAGTVLGGSYGLYRFTADANAAFGPEGDCNRLLVRFNFAYQNNDSFRDFGHEERLLINPAVTYVWDQYNAITYDFQYLTDRRLFDTGLAVVGQVLKVVGQLRRLAQLAVLPHPADSLWQRSEPCPPGGAGRDLPGHDPAPPGQLGARFPRAEL
jgi:iron complex outermembrane receptor protein